MRALPCRVRRRNAPKRSRLSKANSCCAVTHRVTEVQNRALFRSLLGVCAMIRPGHAMQPRRPAFALYPAQWRRVAATVSPQPRVKAPGTVEERGEQYRLQLPQE